MLKKPGSFKILSATLLLGLVFVLSACQRTMTPYAGIPDTEAEIEYSVDLNPNASPAQHGR